MREGVGFDGAGLMLGEQVGRMVMGRSPVCRVLFGVIRPGW